MIRILSIFLGVVFLAGCAGTVTPDITPPSNASLNKNGPHSGIFAFRLSASGGFADQLWYPENRETFNACASKYGKLFVPVIGKDCQIGDAKELHLTQNYPATGWLLWSEYVAKPSRKEPVSPGPGDWQADTFAIDYYVRLLKLRGDDLTP